MAQDISHDPQLIAGLINALDRAEGDAKRAENAVGAALQGAPWLGAASRTYMVNIDEWRSGLAKVQSVLNDLQGRVGAFGRANEQTESDAVAGASSWT